MKRSKFTEAQIAFVLKQAEEGKSVAEVCRKAGIAEATFYNRLSAFTRQTPAGQREGELQADRPALQGHGSATEEQVSEAAGQVKAAGEPERCHPPGKMSGRWILSMTSSRPAGNFVC